MAYRFKKLRLLQLAKRQNSRDQRDFRLPDARYAELGFGGGTGVFEDYEIRSIRGYFPGEVFHALCMFLSRYEGSS